MASNGRGTDSLGNFALIPGFNRPNNKEGYPIMGKKLMVIALAVFAFGVASAVRSNAGSEMIEPYSAPASTYNYAPLPGRDVLRSSSVSWYRRPPGFCVLQTARCGVRCSPI